MLNRPRIEDIAQKLAGLLPTGAHELSEELQKNFRALLTSSLAKLDLVTREEFDVQAAVLARTRARLDALEKQLAQLEERQTPTP
jgi:ubiquinone biosynthesis accessory factor UbiK